VNSLGSSRSTPLIIEGLDSSRPFLRKAALKLSIKYQSYTGCGVEPSLTSGYHLGKLRKCKGKDSTLQIIGGKKKDVGVKEGGGSCDRTKTKNFLRAFEGRELSKNCKKTAHDAGISGTALVEEKKN